MTKFREPQTLEEALDTAAGLIGWDGIAAACGKSTRWCRYWSDVDEDKYQLPAWAVLAIDKACLAQTGHAPLLDALQRIESGFNKREVERCVTEATLAAVTSLGHLSEAVRDAKSPSSVGGERVSDCERRRILKTLKPIKKHVEDIEATLSRAVHTDPVVMLDVALMPKDRVS